jgi:hypothetical protein
MKANNEEEHEQTMIERFNFILDYHPGVELFDRNEIPNSLTGDRVRKLLNQAVRESTGYLELGVYCGGTFCAAMYGNNTPAIAVDSWRETFGITVKSGIKPKDEFHKNTSRLVEAPFTFIESDHWAVNELPFKPDLYFYDGDHSQLAQEKALTHYAPMCSDIFIYFVDDFNWDRVRAGTLSGIQKAGLRIIKQEWLGKDAPESDGLHYWNGVAFLLSK